MKSINPATGKLIKEYNKLDEAGIETAIINAQSAFENWRTTDIAQRQKPVHNLADIIEENMEKNARLMSMEMGKTLIAGLAELEKCIKYCRYTADKAPEFLSDIIVKSEYKNSFTRPLPLGVILLIMPWNFPFWQVLRQAVSAILAGNTILLKHASNVPGCALAIEELFTEAGFPKGVFQTMLIGSGKVELIIRDKRIKGVSLTGSELAGAAVASICGREIKPCVLELGGSDAFIIMPSANMEHALEHAIIGRMRNNGQSCIAAKRMIIHAKIYEEFRAKYIDKINALKTGDPLEDDTDLGPLASDKALAEAQAQIDLAVKSGAKLTMAVQSLPKKGFYIRPSILENISPDNPVYNQEIFAPVAMFFKADNIEHAIKIANDNPYGLGASIFTKDKADMDLAITNLETGSTFINRYTSSDIRLPFGGVKRSGFGREMAREGMLEFCNLKTIIEAN